MELGAGGDCIIQDGHLLWHIPFSFLQMDIKIVIEFSSEANLVIPGNMATLQGSQLIFSCLSAVSPLPLTLWILSLHLFYFPCCIRSLLSEGVWEDNTHPVKCRIFWYSGLDRLKRNSNPQVQGRERNVGTKLITFLSFAITLSPPTAICVACQLLWLMTCMYLHRFSIDFISLFKKGPFDFNVL